MPATHQEHMRHHRACKGKAHASGIGKQANGKTGPASSSSPAGKIIKVTTTGPQKPSKAKNGKEPRKTALGPVESPNGRKLSRNSTSSWEYSDSDSLNSSELGLESSQHHGNGLHGQTNSMIRRIDRVLDDIDHAKSIYDEHQLKLNNNNDKNGKSPLQRGNIYTASLRKVQRKETWADSLRTTCIGDEKIKKMEAGWDDSNIVRTPKERKCHMITAEIEQRDLDSLSRRNSLCRRNSAAGKVVKRPRVTNQGLCDVIEWEVLLELAQATRNGHRRRESDRRNGFDGGYLKDLEVLLNSAAPRNFEVLSCYI